MPSPGADPDWTYLHPREANEVWRSILRPIGAELKTHATGFALEIVEQLRAGAGEDYIGADTVDEALLSTEESLRLLGQIVESGSDPAATDVPPSTLALIRSTVWRHVPRSFQTQFYRVGQQEVWRWLHSRINARTSDPMARTAAIELMTILVMEYIDQAVARTGDIYEREREAWFQGAAALRAAAVEDVLGERAGDSDLMSGRLRYELNRHHRGLIAWVDPAQPSGASVSDLHAAITAVARANGSDTVLTHPVGAAAMAGWFSRPQEAGPDFTVPRRPDSGLALPAGVRLSVGRTAHGINGFRTTHAEAGYARTVAAALPHSAEPVTKYSDVSLMALGLADPRHAERFVTRVLGRLASTDESVARLAETLAVFLKVDRSPRRAATELHVHPNTVIYRIRQAEELLGREIDVDSLELRVALAVLPAVARRTAR